MGLFGDYLKQVYNDPQVQANLGMLRGFGGGLRDQVQGLWSLANTRPEAFTPAVQDMARRTYDSVSNRRTASDVADYVKQGLFGFKDEVSGALQDPVKMGGLLASYVDPVRVAKGLLSPAVRDMTVYHGSPHDFEKFDLSKIGTGEGAQAYGHGLYFAENPGVARSYMAQDIPYNVIPKDEAARAAYSQATNFTPGALKGVGDALNSAGGDPLAAAKTLREFYANGAKPDFAQTYNSLADMLERGDLTPKKSGHFYTVDLPDEHVAKMLDWDKPLAEQPESVRKAVKTLAVKAEQDAANPGALSGMATWSDRTARRVSPDMLDQMDGAAIHEMLQKVYGNSVSNQLRALGIPGIRYLDGSSRGAGQGTRNFVVFDDKLVKVLKKD